jgi:hypothetical protein
MQILPEIMCDGAGVSDSNALDLWRCNIHLLLLNRTEEWTAPDVVINTLTTS